MKRKDIILILIPTFVFVLVWIGFNIYHNSITSTLTNNEVVQITAINPTFDLNTLNSLKQREQFVPYNPSATESQVIITPIPTPEITAVNTSTQSANEATPAGGLTQ